MPDPTLPAGVSWREVVAGMEAMDPADLAAMLPPSPTTAELIERFPALADVDVHDLTIEGPHGPVPARVYRPGGPVIAGFVWAHGGGFIGGDLDMPEAHWVGLSVAASGLVVLSVDYRKCLNGVTYPVPSDDVLAGWTWAVGELGVPVERLHLGGASAGANLVAGVTKRLRDGAGPVPASLVLAYPVVHPELPPLSAAVVAAIGETGSFSPEIVAQMSEMYIGSTEGFDDPYAFPANGDLSGQPPVYILDSEADSLRASGEAYAVQLAAAGVDVTVEFEPGTAHGHLNEPDDLGGRASIERIVRWLHDH